MNWNLFLAYAGGLILLYLVARLLFLPARMLGRLLGNAILGGVVLLLINWVGRALPGLGFAFTFHLPLNPLTALLVGILGIPGVILVAILQRMLGS